MLEKYKPVIRAIQFVDIASRCEFMTRDAVYVGFEYFVLPG
jgi:hypothetical protein